MKKRGLGIIIVLMMIFQFLTPTGRVFAKNDNQSYLENEAVEYRITSSLSDDKKLASVTLELKEKEGVKVSKIVFPNGEEQDFTDLLMYEVETNGELLFVIKYIVNQSQKETSIFYSVNGIEVENTDVVEDSEINVVNETPELNEGKENYGATQEMNTLNSESEQYSQEIKLNHHDDNNEIDIQNNQSEVGLEVNNVIAHDTLDDEEILNVEAVSLIRGVPENILTITSPVETQYYGEINITSNIVIDGSGLKQTISPAVLEVELPTSLYQGSSPITNSFIDHASISTVPGLGSNPMVITNGDKTVLRLELSKIDNTTQLTIPYVFSFKDRLTPNGYSLTPKVTLNDGSDIVSQKNDKTFEIKYDQAKLSKYIRNLGVGGFAYAGMTQENDNNRISETHPDVVSFTFSAKAFGNLAHYRKLETIVLTDTLPTYINSKGENVTAKFDPKLNPEWIDNGDGTVSITIKHPLNDSSDFIPPTVQLNLLFPDAPIKENGKDIKYTNTISMVEKPYNQGENENVIHEASVDFYLKGHTYNGEGMLSKSLKSGFIVYDQLSLYLERPTYQFNLINKFNVPLTEITITEDGESFDARLYLSEFVLLNKIDGNNQHKPIDEFVTIRAYRQDGSYIDIPMHQYLKVNESVEEEINKTAQKVDNGIISANETQAGSPEFVKFTLMFENEFALLPGEQIYGHIKMAFKDPYNVKFSDKLDIKNIISISASYTNIYGDKIPLNFSSEANTKFLRANENISLTKMTNGQRIGDVGEKLSFRISLYTNGLLKNRYLKNPTFVDLLPQGVNVTDTTSITTFYNSDKYFENWEIIENYQNTGRTAILIRFKSGKVFDLQGGDQNAPFSLNFYIDNLVINENIIPSLAETSKINNDNRVFFFTDDGVNYPDEVSSHNNLVEDKYDINQNGKINDKIIMASSKVLGTKAEGIYSSKSIRSLEPIGQDSHLNYFSEWVENIKTSYSGKSESHGRFQYKLQINNYTRENKNSFVFYDVLPYKGDGLQSQFNNEFMGNVMFFAGEENVTDQFIVYYRTDKYPTTNAAVEMNNEKWTQTPDLLSDVTAIKAVMRENSFIKPYTILTMTWDMKAPDYDSVGDLKNQSAQNLFYVSYNNGTSFEQTNIVKNTLPGKWTPMIPPTREVKVTKAWDLLGTEKPVEVIEVELYKDGVATGKKLELNETNNWSGSLKGLEVADGLGSTNYYQYTVKEVGEVSGSVKLTDKWFKVTYTGDMAEGFTITNKELQPWTPMIPPTREVKVTKAWDLLGTEKPVEVIEVELYKDGVATGKKLELNETNNWSGSFKGLEVADGLGSTNYYQYTVKEVGEVSGSVKLTDKWFKVTYTGDMAEGFTITNKELQPWTPMIPPTREVKVTKVWDLLGNEKPVEVIEVELFKDGVATGKKLELNEVNNWSGTFKGLEVAESLGSTNYYQYTVKEVGEVSGSVKLTDKWFKVTYTGDMAEGFTIMNNELQPWTPMVPPTREVKVTKAWDLLGTEKPVEVIEVELFKDGVATGKKLELNEANNWSGTFKGLEVAESLGSTNYYQYTVKEVGEVSGSVKLTDKWFKVTYTGDMANGFTIMNNELQPWTPMVPPTREVKVTKAWDLLGTEKPVEVIEVELFKDGVATGKKLELNEANNWTGIYENLPVSATLDGAVHQYTVKEVGETGNSIQLSGKWFKVTYTGDMAEGFTIMNNELQPWTPMVPPTREVKVTKVWDLLGNEKPVEVIEVELYKDGQPTGQILELNETNNWSGSFKGLEVAESLGSTNYYQYTVKEVGETDNSIQLGGKEYKVSYDGNMLKGFKVTNKELPVPQNPVPNIPNKPNELPNTGFIVNPNLLASLLVLAGGVLLLFENKRKKR